MFPIPTRTTSIVLVTLVFVAAAACDTAAQGPARTYPSLNGAVKKPAAWLGKEVPFDVAAYFAAPPPGQNAAPLYLDAIFEFSAEVSSCFAPGPGTEARTRTVRERTQLVRPLQEAFARDPASVDRVALKSALENYKVGFQKLGQAQRRPRCVFENGLGMLTLLPHAQAAREVVRVTQLSSLVSLDRGDLAACISNIEGVLRLARDLQPRGPMICQLVSIALRNVVSRGFVAPILSHPKLTAAQCTRLIKAFTDHESRAIDGYSEGLKAEYLMARTTLRDASGRPGDPDRATAEQAKTETLRMLGEISQDPNWRVRMVTMLADLAKATPQDYAEAVAAINTHYRDLLAAAKLPFAQRQAKVQSAGGFPASNSSAPVELARLLNDLVSTAAIIEAFRFADANLHGIETLAAVRRWQIAHKNLPKDLAAACKEAGLKSVPIDPYSGKPVKFVVLNGRPVVYSVGKDGKDDGGRTDNKFNSQPGDLIYCLDAQR